MLNTNFSPWPSFTAEEAEAVANVLLSNRVNYWTGSEGTAFEKEFAEYVGTEHAIALANGTLALDLALRAIGLGEGDEVIVTSRTFIASVSSIVIAGGTPVFADVSRDSQNITPESIAAKLSDKTKAIVCVHLAGWPCEMDKIMEIARDNGLFVIEDCAQAHGAKFDGQSVGSFGHVGCWSFCQDKILTTGGEGGMVTTSDSDLWAKMWAYKDHGKSYAAVTRRDHPPGFRWLHESMGSNYRMMEMQAAIGRIQLKRLDEWSGIRRKNARSIWDAAKKINGLRVPEIPDNMLHAAYKCYVFVDNDSLRADWNRDRILAQINEMGVPCYSGSCSEVYLEKAFADSGFTPAERLAVARELGDTALMFLVHPTLTAEEIDATCETLQAVMSEAAPA